jgi:hypothetical protein
MQEVCVQASPRALRALAEFLGSIADELESQPTIRSDLSKCSQHGLNEAAIPSEELTTILRRHAARRLNSSLH